MKLRGYFGPLTEAPGVGTSIYMICITGKRAQPSVRTRPGVFGGSLWMTERSLHADSNSAMFCILVLLKAATMRVATITAMIAVVAAVVVIQLLPLS